jgi:ketosteroid isomerase-like protein
VKLFTDNVIWEPPDSPIAKSKEEIKNSLQKGFDTYEYNLSPGILEIDIKGDIAHVFCTDFRLTLKSREGDEEIMKKASTIWLLEKQDDGWKIFRQVYNIRDDNF